jgi:hypothetical protein
LGVEKNAAANKLFMLIKKIDKQIEEQPIGQPQDNSALEAVREENQKVKQELEGKLTLKSPCSKDYS